MLSQPLILQPDRLFVPRSCTAALSQQLETSSPGIMNALHTIQKIENWTRERAMLFLRSCHTSGCGGDHELPAGQKSYTTLNCPWNSGGLKGTNLGCCHAQRENFQGQGAYPKLAALGFIFSRNGWISEKVFGAQKKFLTQVGGILIKMDKENSGKAQVTTEELIDFKRRQKELGTMANQEVVVPLKSVLASHLQTLHVTIPQLIAA